MESRERHSVRTLPMADEEWMEDAKCRGADAPPPNFFFPQQGNKAAREVKKFCEGCPVKETCLQYGLNETHGVWGGTSETERRAIRKRLKERGAPLRLEDLLGEGA